jgi:hypothetical protein
MTVALNIRSGDLLVGWFPKHSGIKTTSRKMQEQVNILFEIESMEGRKTLTNHSKA